MLGLMDFSDLAILCNRPNNCCQQNLKCFDEPLFSLRLGGVSESMDGWGCAILALELVPKNLIFT